MTARVFITGTGTDIGKTYVTSRLAKRIRALGRTVGVLKPIISGFDIGDPENDVAVLLKSVGLPYTTKDIDEVSLYRLAAPLSPDMAASREGVVLDFNTIRDFCLKPSEAEIVLIEGAGGVMSPVTSGRTALDLMKATEMPCLLVTGTYLGAVSHTLTACSTLKAAGVKILSVVISESARGAVSVEEMAETLERFVESPVRCLKRGDDSVNKIIADIELLLENSYG